MTSPDSVGSVSVEIEADAKALSKSLKAEVEKAFKKIDPAKAIQDSVGKKPIKVPVQTDTDTGPLKEKIGKTRVPKVEVPLDPKTEDIPEKVKGTKVPKVPVPLDPLMQAFQAEVRRQTTALARQVNVNVPVDGDTSGLRAKLGTDLAAISAQTKIKVPTEPEAKAAYEAKLKAQLAEVAARVKQTVKVDVDVDKDAIGGAVARGAGSALSGIAAGFQQVSQAAVGAAGSAVQFGGSLVGAVNTASGPIGLVVGALIFLGSAIAATAGAAVFAVPAITALSGAIAALPGILAGAGAGFGTLALGFKGISDAFKPKAGGGGGGGGGGEDAASRARRIAGAERGVEAARRGIAGATRALQSANRGLEQAERGVADAQARVADAQRRALQAQQAVNRARREAKEDIEDLNRSLRGASLNEEDAALRVTEALRELNAVKEKGVLPDIQRADLEYRQAQQALEEAKDSTEDLGEAAADANAKGVEGSDKVQDALQDQVEANNAVKDAIRGVADAQIAVIEAQNGVLSANDALKSSYDGLASAQDSLAEAQKRAAAAGGGGGAALADVVKLAPAAQKFVDAVKNLKPQFEELRLLVQERLFKGLDKTITSLAASYKEPLKRIFGSYADTFNGFFKNLGSSLGKPQFIKDLETGAEGARKGLDKILDAVGGPLVKAFGTLSAAAAPFMEALGEEIGKVVTEFSRWVQAGKESGRLEDFFENATITMREIFKTGKTVASIIGSLISIIAGRRTIGNNKTPLQQFNEGLQKVSAYLDDPAHQEGIRQFFESIVDGIESAARVVKKIDGWIDKIQDLKDALTGDDQGKFSAKRTSGGGAKDLGPAAPAAMSPTLGTTNGSAVGTATGDGFLSGFTGAIQRAFNTVASLLWSGPGSLLGKIKAGLGIASPSTLTTTMGQELVNGLIKGIGEKFEELKNKAGELPGKIRDGIGNAAGYLVQKGKDFGTGLRAGINATRETVTAKAGELKTRIGNAFSNAGTFLTGRGQSIGNSLRTGLSQVAGNIGIAASNLKVRIQNALLNAGTLLTGTGRNLVYGLYNGIASLGNWLRDRVIAFARATIPGPLHKFFGIASPSKLMAELGGFVGEGLALGIESEEARVARAAQALAAAALPDVGAVGLDLTAAGDAAIRSSLSVAGANTLQASWAPGMTGDKILDALKGSIKFSHRGDVIAALGSA